MRRAGVGLALTWWVVAAGLGALRWVDAGGVVPALQSGLPLVGLSLLPLLALALVLRARAVAAATGALMLPWVWVGLPWWMGDDARAGGLETTVLVSNLQYGAGDLAEIEQQVQRRGVDALVLLEVTPDVVAEIDTSSIAEALPHRSGQARTDAGGTLVLTADEHEAVPAPAPMSFDQVAVTVDGDDTGRWTLLGAHPVPPLDTATWRREIALLGEWVDQSDPAIPLVVAGDLNSSPAHPAYRAAVGDLDHAHEVVGAGWVRTWPVGSVLPAYVQLDHVLSRGWGVRDAGVQALIGTDHAAVWAVLARP